MEDVHMKNKPYPRVVVAPPGPKARDIVRRDSEVLSPYNRPFYYPFVVQSGKGCIVKDVDGNEYIDFNSGICVMNVGHCHPSVVEAVSKQVGELVHYSYTDFYYPYVVDLAEKLCKIVPGDFRKRVFFGNSGAESVEAAIKVARWHMERPLFIGFIGAFHGRTMGALSATASKTVQRARFFPTMPGVFHVPYAYCYRCIFNVTYPDCNFKCIDFIDEMVLKKYVPPEETAAIIFEPIQGEGGYIVPPPGYFERLKKLADKYGILLLDDEVQTGMGRTGEWFGIQHWNVQPDILCISKAIASGISLGAVVTRAEVMNWEAGAHCTTLGANPVACAAAIAVIDVIRREKLLENARKQGEHIVKWFRDLQDESKIIGDVRGKGLMIGVEVVKDKDTKEPAGKEVGQIIRNSWKKGVVVITAGDSTIRIAPPLTITRDLVDAGIEIIGESIRDVERHMR